MEMLKEMICPHCGAELKKEGISIKTEFTYYWDNEKEEFVKDADSYYIDFVRCTSCFEGIEEEVFGDIVENLNLQGVLKGKKAN